MSQPPVTPVTPVTSVLVALVVVGACAGEDHSAGEGGGRSLGTSTDTSAAPSVPSPTNPGNTAAAPVNMPASGTGAASSSDVSSDAPEGSTPSSSLEDGSPAGSPGDGEANAGASGTTPASPDGEATPGGAGGRSVDGQGGSSGQGGDDSSSEGSVAVGGGGSGVGGSNGEPEPEGSASGHVELVGFATQNGGTIGGEGGEVVTASNFDELRSYAESSEPYVIMVEGTISNGANGGELNVQSNKSLIGVGDSAFLNGIGLDINNVSNIIIQNLRISLIGVTTRTDTDGVYSMTGDEGLPQILVNGGDTISIRGSSKNIWIDHCELFSEDPNTQTNKDLYDGLIDVKNETGFITISWNYFHDHHKGGLVGASDSDVYGDRKITFHHNHYDNVKLRIPMYRGSTGHFFNNYIVGATDASEIRAGTCVRVERNYYEALHYSIYTPSDAPGSTERIDNIEVERSSRDYPSDCTADIPYDYSGVLISNTEDVRTLVSEQAGVGKL